jgi:hypothetical protein
MSGTEDPPSSVEVFLNEQRADLQVLQMTVQILLMRLLGSTPPSAAAGMVDEMEDLMMHAMRTTPASAPDAQRMQQLTTMRAQDFFQRVGKGMGYPPRTTTPSGPVN